MRWIFDLQGGAIQASHVQRFSWSQDVTASTGNFAVLAHIQGPAHPFVISRHDTLEQAIEQIKNLVVGRHER